MPIAFVALVFATGIYRWNPFMFPVDRGRRRLPASRKCGWCWRVSARQHRLRRGLPDGLDLLVICVEAGLGLDQALMKVAQELRITHPELSDELQLVNLEMRIGKTRIDALRELARRTGSGRHQVAGRHADPDRSLWHQRCSVVARLLRRFAHQAASTRGRNERQDHASKWCRRWCFSFSRL